MMNGGGGLGAALDYIDIDSMPRQRSEDTEPGPPHGAFQIRAINPNVLRYLSAKGPILRPPYEVGRRMRIDLACLKVC